MLHCHTFNRLNELSEIRTEKKSIWWNFNSLEYWLNGKTVCAWHVMDVERYRNNKNNFTWKLAFIQLHWVARGRFMLRGMWVKKICQSYVLPESTEKCKSENIASPREDRRKKNVAEYRSVGRSAHSQNATEPTEALHRHFSIIASFPYISRTSTRSTCVTKDGKMFGGLEDSRTTHASHTLNSCRRFFSPFVIPISIQQSLAPFEVFVVNAAGNNWILFSFAFSRYYGLTNGECGCDDLKPREQSALAREIYTCDCAYGLALEGG